MTAKVSSSVKIGGLEKSFSEKYKELAQKSILHLANVILGVVCDPLKGDQRHILMIPLVN